MDIKALIRLCLAVVIATLPFSSCIREDLSSCVSQCTIQFSYAHTEPNSDTEFPAPVKIVRLYVFDESRRFVTAIDKSVPEESTLHSFTMNWEIPPGTYSFVAWAGERNLQLTTAVLNNDVATREAFVPGQTTIDQALIMLDNATSLSRSSSSTITSGDQINLYYGYVESLEIVPGRENRTEISLVRSSHDIIVRISDKRAQHADVASCKVSATLPNSILTFKHELSGMAQTVGYVPYRINSENPNIQSSALSVLRMHKNMQGDLVVTDSGTNTELFRKSLLSEIISQHPYISSDPDFNLEKYYTYLIDLEINDSKIIICITIDDWTVRLVDTDM